jgi:hypothetical protein
MEPMVLSKPTKVLIGLATCWPFLYICVAFVFIILHVFVEGTRPPRAHAGPAPWFAIFFVLHLLTILGMFGLLTFYMVYLFRTDRVGQDKKAFWAVVLFLGNLIAMPIFFVLYIWPDLPKNAEPPAPAAFK